MHCDVPTVPSSAKLSEPFMKNLPKGQEGAKTASWATPGILHIGGRTWCIPLDLSRIHLM